MARLLSVAAGVFLFVGRVSAQQPTRWKVLGDTSGAPTGCSTAAAINTINLWFSAYNGADSLGLSRAMAVHRPGGWVFSSGHFTPQDTFVRIQALPELVLYARARAQHEEHLRLTVVRFYGWRGRTLSFMPYYSRSATDLGPTPRAGTGKAVYACGQGIFKFNLAGRPA
jgi:hypothetical protein